MNHHVIVVGGGFAGVACANRLAGEPRVRVTLVDRNGYHQFQPLLYQVASAELAPDDIRFDLAGMYEHHDRVEVRSDEVVAVDPAGPSVTLADGAGSTATMRWLLIWTGIALVTVVPALLLLYVLDQRGDLGEDPVTARETRR